MPTAESSTPAEPPRLWIPDPEALYDGDVLLEYGSTRMSPVIKTLDRGNYSHALIWAGNTDFVEAVPGGVRIIGYLRVLIESPDRWLLLRQTDRALGQQAALAARKFVGKRYDYLGAFSSKWSGVRTADPELLFCTQLVAEAYLAAGLELFPGLAPTNVTPRMLEECPRFERKSPPLKELSSPDRARALEFRDRDGAYEGTIMEKEAYAARTAFKKVKPLLSDLSPSVHPDVRFPPGNLHELLDVLRCSDPHAAAPIATELLANLSAVNYFNFLDGPIVEEVRQRIIEDAMRLRFSHPTEDEQARIRERLRREHASWTVSITRHQTNASVCDSEWRRTGLPLWQELASMYQRNWHRMQILRILAGDVLSDAWTAGQTE